MTELHCPNCRKRFATIRLKDGAAVCPHCEDVMFHFRLPSEDGISKADFMKLLEGERGKAAVKAAQKWIRYKHSLAIAAAFVAYVWQKASEAMETEKDRTLNE